MNNFREIFQFVILLCLTLPIPLSSIRRVHWMYRNGYKRVYVICINSYSRHNVFKWC